MLLFLETSEKLFPFALWSFVEIHFNILPFLFCFRFIEEEDLLKFMIKEEVDLVLPLFEVADTRQIDRKALTNWVVRSCVYYLSFSNIKSSSHSDTLEVMNEAHLGPDRIELEIPLTLSIISTFAVGYTSQESFSFDDS